MNSRIVRVSTTLGYAGGVLILALIWIPPLAIVLPVPPIVVMADSLWTGMGWWGLLIGLILAVLLVYLSKSGKRWAAWSSLVAGALMMAGGLTMLVSNMVEGGGFLWAAIVVLALAGVCHFVSGLLRITTFRTA